MWKSKASDDKLPVTLGDLDGFVDEGRLSHAAVPSNQ
jgi:hypothetical protein